MLIPNISESCLCWLTWEDTHIFKKNQCTVLLWLLWFQVPLPIFLLLVYQAFLISLVKLVLIQNILYYKTVLVQIFMACMYFLRNIICSLEPGAMVLFVLMEKLMIAKLQGFFFLLIKSEADKCKIKNWKISCYKVLTFSCCFCWMSSYPSSRSPYISIYI